MGEGPEVSAAMVDGRGGGGLTLGSSVFFEKAGVPTEGRKKQRHKSEVRKARTAGWE